MKGNPNLDLIRLGIGDPSVYGNFNPPSVALDAILGELEEGKQSHAEGPPCGAGFWADRACMTMVINCVFYCTLGLCVKPLTTAGLLCARQAVADLYSSLGEEVSPEVSEIG